MGIEEWKDDGAPQIVNAKVVNAVALIARVYEGWDPELPEDVWETYPDFPSAWLEGYGGNLGGGNLHIIVDDDNIDDGYFVGDFGPDVCPWMNMTGPPHQVAVQRACYDLLKTMTLEERISALAWYRGYITEDIPGAPPQRAWYARRVLERVWSA